MKKPLTMPEEAQPRNITRADLVLAEGFGLEVDGRIKTVFPTLAAAQKRARDLKAEFPMLQIKVYDAEKKTRTLVESDKRLSPSRSEARQWLASRIFACAGIDLIEYLRTIASTLRWIERTREPCILLISLADPARLQTLDG